MLKTPLVSMLLVLAASLLGAVGQFLFQHASKATKGGLVATLLSPWALAGMASYVSVMILFTTAFRMGGSVKVLYPIYASTFIWAALLSLAFFGQPVRPIHGLGMLLLVLGIACMSW
jgi:multidrug transporter EmrE-like cation transporter